MNHHNSLKLSFTNIRGLCSNTVGCESFLKSCSTHIIALYKTNSNDSINSSNITVTGYIPLIWKNSVTHIHNLAVYVGTVIRKVQDFLFVFFLNGFTSFVLHIFLSITVFAFVHGYSCYFIWHKYVLSINRYANVLFFRTYKIHHKDWLTYSSETSRLKLRALCAYASYPYSIRTLRACTPRCLYPHK